MAKNHKDGRYARLQIDYTDLMNLANRSKFIAIDPVEPEPGWPPEKYLITFTCLGIARIQADGTPQKSSHHQVELYLSREYPSKEPSLLWKTDIWHPNIDNVEPRHVCTNAVQTYYVAKPLAELVLSLAEMVQYKRYYAAMEAPFPLNLDAARWVRDIAEPNGWIGPQRPFDARPLLREHKIRRHRKGAARTSRSNRDTASGSDPGNKTGGQASPERRIKIGTAKTPEPSSVAASLHESVAADAPSKRIVFGLPKD